MDKDRTDVDSVDALKSFRYDINALRAFSIAAVLAFHFFPAVVPGGFIGVDVFFVISGYLMTAILTNAVPLTAASYFRFLRRRAARILPELLLMILALLALATALFPSYELRALAREALLSVLQIANIGYYLQVGYFDIAAHGKWLLHTWSLSVEMQLYLVFPFAIVLILYASRNSQRYALVALTAFIASVLPVLIFSQDNGAAAFFLLPFRFWEFLAGTVVFYAFRTRGTRAKAPLALWFGISLLMLGIFIAPMSSAWPSALTLIPVVGAGLVIFGYDVSSKLLRNRLVVWVGTISYSAYVWHWPIVVFLYKMDFLGQLLPSLTGLAISLALAHVSNGIYLRTRSLTQEWSVFTFLGTIVIAAAVAIAAYLFQPANPKEVKSMIATMERSPYRERCHASADRDILPEEACVLPPNGVNHSTPANVAIFGDSHSVELAYALSEYQRILQLSHSNCAPILDDGDQNECVAWVEESLSLLRESESIDTVVLVWRYALYPFGIGLDESNGHEEGLNFLSVMEDGIDRIVSDLVDSGKQVILVGPIPELENDIRNAIFRLSLFSDESAELPYTTLSNYNQRQGPILQALRRISKDHEISYVDPRVALCGLEVCDAIRNEVSLYFDDNHLSVAGAQLLAIDIAQSYRQR